MNDQAYRTIILAKTEDRNREFKGTFPWDEATHKGTLARITKTVLAMSNLLDGGTIIVGVKEVSAGAGFFEPTGVLAEHLETFKPDRVADFVRKYAEPAADFDPTTRRHDSMLFVVFAVRGFHDTPVICRADLSDVLRAGEIYVRPRSGRPRSERVNSYVDMRDLVELATEKEIRRRLGSLGGLGALLTTGPSTRKDDETRFEQQLKDFK